MFQNFDITSANAELVLTVAEIFPAGFSLEGFGTDQAASMDAIDISETQMGVDGKMVAGYTPAIYPFNLTLQAASPSHSSLSTIWAAMKANKRIYPCAIICTLPSIKSRFIWSKGVLKNGVVLPPLQKVLGPTTWLFHFEKFERVRF